MALETIIDIILAIIAVAAMAKAFGLWPHEKEKMDAEAAKNYAEAAKMAAERAEFAEKKLHERDEEITRLKKDLDDLRNVTTKEISTLTTEISALRKELMEANTYIIKLLEGINVLIRQLFGKDVAPEWKPEPRE